jgi:hypothetical protein
LHPHRRTTRPSPLSEAQFSKPAKIPKALKAFKVPASL